MNIISAEEYRSKQGKKLPLSDLKAKEGKVVQACIAWLYHHGCDVMRCNTGTAHRSYTLKSTGQEKQYRIRFGKLGAGDIIACSPTGKWIEVECKNAIGRQRLAQIERQRQIEKRRGIYILARSTDDLDARKGEILA